MTIAAFSKKPRNFVPSSCKGEDSPPIFSIRRLDPLEMFDVMERHGLDIETVGDELDIEKTDKELPVKELNVKELAKNIRVAIDYLKIGLVGWERVLDEEGDSLEFNIANIRCLNMEIMMELARAVQGVVSEEEEKNSESSPESASGLATTE